VINSGLQSTWPVVKNTWNAEMYNAAEGSFVKVKLVSKSGNKLSISFNGEEVLGLFR
jgi:hypothetical protein